MISGAMDRAARGSYLRGVGSKRPSATVTLVTVVAGCALAVGGYVVGNSSGAGELPARVPLRSLTPPQADPIVMPSDVDLPRR
jgi:hypothetical protein